ncbi:MAG: primosomal protein N' [Candidatus Omnitrophica bacterium]|nr:primosomal protein N' [Candidatus Omnitrophota bacterium]
MTSAKIAKIVFGLPVEGPFDYSIGEQFKDKIALGQRVKVMFNRRMAIGYVVGLDNKSDFPNLNPILEILDEGSPALDLAARDLAKKISEQFGCSLGEAMEIQLPPALRKKSFYDLPVISPALNPTRFRVSTRSILCETDRSTCWSILKEKIKINIDQKKSVLILAPDTYVLQNALKELKEFKSILLVFKKPVTAKKDLNGWVTARTEPGHIILGTRSTVFTPVKDLGLIIMLDEENTSYKEEQPPHYHTRQVVLWQSDSHGCEVTFVSIAPSVELWYLAHKDQWTIDFPRNAGHPVQMKLVDQSNYKRRYDNLISYPLQNEINAVLKNNGKILLFMNRRGFALATRCNHCGFTLKCPRCAVNLTYMYSQKKMSCRFCSHKEEIPKICPSCGSDYMRSTGTGVEKLQSTIAMLFPTAKIGYFDKESESYPTDKDIVIATQAVLRWKDQIKADLTAVLDLDAELNRFDHTSSHKVFSLLMNLRQMTKEALCVQTHMPGNYLIACVGKMDWGTFYQQELLQRKELNFPPYKDFVSIGLRGLNEDHILKQSAAVCEGLKRAFEGKDVEVFEPQPDLVPKLRDQYRYTIMLRTENAVALLHDIKNVLRSVKHSRGVTMSWEII